MKKSKKITVPSLAIVIALLLSGCAENAEEPNNPASTSSTAAPQITVNTDEKNEASAKEDVFTEADTEKTVQTEEEDLPPDESLFEYYDLLNEEYEKYGVTSSMGGTYFSSKEKTMAIPMNSSSVGKILLLYNIENKTKKFFWDTDVYGKRICNDVMYHIGEYSTWHGKVYLRKYDGTSIPDEDEPGYYLDYFTFTGENEAWDSIKYIHDNLKSIISQPDGTVFLSCQIEGETWSGEPAYFMVSSDYETLTMLPKPTIEVEHGFTETREFNILACYNNKLFAYTEDIGFCCLDTDNLTWERLDLNVNFKGYSSCKSIGRYLLFDNGIYDMETKEVLVYNDYFPVSFASSYYGGKYNVAQIKGKWYFLRCASDGSDIDLKYFVSYDIMRQPNSSCTPITDKYYIYEDNYGYFLRSYEKGAEKEETMWLKDEIENLTPDEINNMT